jgi:DNA polymerase-3 subunit gamma/tau
MKVISTEPIAIEDPDLVVFAAKPGYNSLADACETREALEKIGQGMQRLLRRPVRVRYKRTAAVEMPQGSVRGHEGRPPDVLASDPMVQKIVELFEARPFRLEYDEEPGTA